MSARSEAELFLKKVSGEIARAVALSQLLNPIMVGEFVAAANKRQMGDGFGLIRDALHKDLILTLIKLMDQQPGALSFPRFFEKLAQVWREENCGRPHQMLAAKRTLVQLDKAGTLRALRNKALAHTDNENPNHGARWGEEKEFLRLSIELLEHTSQALGKSSLPFIDAFACSWSGQAAQFWAKALT